MKLYRLLTVIISSALVTGIATIIYSQPSYKDQWLVGTQASRYIDLPAPAFPDNSALPESSLLTKEQIFSTLRFPSDAKVVGLSLKKWGERPSKQKGTLRRLVNNNCRGGTERAITYRLPANSRQIWVLNSEFSNYQEKDVKPLNNAKVTFVFDAETGQLLQQMIGGCMQ